MNTMAALFRSFSGLTAILLLMTVQSGAQVPLPGSMSLTPDAAWESTNTEIDQLRARCWASEETVARA